jgi:hypothetical protein
MVNKRATDKHLTRYLHTISDKTALVHEYILRGFVDKGGTVYFKQARLFKSRLGLVLQAMERTGWA